MAGRTSIAIPTATIEYNESNESIARRTVEQAIENIHTEIDQLKRMQESLVSKATRRHQFLLMGVKHGG